MACDQLTDSFEYEENSSLMTESSYITDSPPYDSSTEFDTDLEEIEDEKMVKESHKDRRPPSKQTGIRIYRRTCREYQVRPIRSVIKQLTQTSMYLGHVKMNHGQCQALILALMKNSCLERIELKENGLTEENVLQLMNVLNDAKKIYHMGLAGNEIQIDGAKVIDDILKRITCLTHLNLSGCKLGDRETEYIAEGLESNYGLKWLNLSQNSISVEGGKKLGKAIEDTPKLDYLNLSWNHIRLKGAVALIQGLQSNSSLSTLDLAMNGIGFDGCLALEDTLRENTMLKYFDISNNRIDWDGITFIANGLKRNTTLEILNLGNNPINIQGCIELLTSISTQGNKLISLDLTNIPVNKQVVKLSEDIKKERKFNITYGHILDVRDIIGIKKEKREEDHITFLLRFLASLELRFLPELFRPFDRHRDGLVVKRDFIKAIKKMNVPLSDRELLILSSNLDKNKTGYINYSILCQDVKNFVKDRERKAKEKAESIKINKGTQKKY